ncbi:MAG: hypothetical protein QM813_11030 [Verrucomicrobiota bacterium]
MAFQFQFDSAPKAVRRSAGIAVIILSLAAFGFGFAAVSAESSGSLRDWGKRWSPVVTRESAPEVFRQNIHLRWAAAGFCVLVASGSFLFYRKLGDYV